ncbi:unnamed protein product [Acanthoscelides obtectus]|uniref:Uncharacterized protein n=1 Tax=Acanthoscelides obtectus TaxID=200917 RepID=A0A9P0LDM8_ACAOB|nr:unnamed protein product [Acanthoscelides obtectus]CAK1670070.1 hypothetical protein AOBTE_LOCUS27372 [Acanthoscelides obtectus]
MVRAGCCRRTFFISCRKVSMVTDLGCLKPISKVVHYFLTSIL